MTTIESPRWGRGTVGVARDVVRNNPRIVGVDFMLRTDATWLPHALVEAGFFPSGAELRRNQPRLWRDLEPGETVELSWARITFVV